MITILRGIESRFKHGNSNKKNHFWVYVYDEYFLSINTGVDTGNSSHN